MSHIVIIGGGITGLSAAWELQQHAEHTYSLVESSGRWGGKVETQTVFTESGSFIIDGGPESFVTRKPEVWDLAMELGLQNEITDPGPETRNIFVLDGGKPYAIPLSPAGFFSTPLMSWRGKLRLISEPFQKPRRDDGDESLADFVTRRLGTEALEKFIGPVLGGIYNTDPRRQSIMVSSPVMREMEKEAGSLVLASIRRMFGKKPGINGTQRPPRFITFKTGTQNLVDALSERLTGDLRLNTPVAKVERAADMYSVQLANGNVIQADAVIVATLANVTAPLIHEIAPQAAAGLASIPHQNIGTISLVFKETDIPAEPVINGLMIPRRENRAVDAITFTSRKMPSRSMPGQVLLRVFLGGGRPDVVTMDDNSLLEVVRKELGALLGIHAAPQAYAIFRWPLGFPQATVGHLKRIDEIESQLPPGLFLAGSSYRGIAVPECIRQGRAAARQACSR